jgi:hypothetical protein
MFTYSRMHASKISAVSVAGISRFDRWPRKIPRDKTPDDSMIMLCPPTVFGFMLQEKTWRMLSLYSLKGFETYHKHSEVRRKWDTSNRMEQTRLRQTSFKSQDKGAYHRSRGSSDCNRKNGRYHRWQGQWTYDSTAWGSRNRQNTDCWYAPVLSWASQRKLTFFRKRG